MSTAFPGFSGPTASTEAPLEMLAACHIRIDRQCSTLKRLARHLSDHSVDAQASSAAAQIMRYFDSAAIHHHADEEQDLFPALIESMAGSDAVCIRELINGLIADHRQLEAMWGDLRSDLAQIAQGRSAILSVAQLDAFVSLYDRHMKTEEDELIPMAARLLSDAAITQIGLSMRKRRGIGDIGGL